MKPLLDKEGVRLIAIGIGTAERAKEFCAHVGFPEECLYADPENVAYDALQLNSGIGSTFFRPETPLALLRRVFDGKTGDLGNALSRWQVWIPPKLEQGLQQGGVFAFEGTKVVFQHYDPSTGKHADFSKVLASVGVFSKGGDV